MKRILYGTGIIFLLFFFCRSFLVKNAASVFLKKRFNIDCSIDDINIGGSGILLKGVRLARDGAIVDADSVYAVFRSFPFMPRGGVCIEAFNVNLEIKETAVIGDLFRSQPDRYAGAGENNAEAFVVPVNFSVYRFVFSLKNSQGFMLQGRCSYAGRFSRKEGISIDRLDLTRGGFKTPHIDGDQIMILPVSGDEYILSAKTLKIKEKECGPLSSLLAFGHRRISFEGLRSPLMGAEGVVSGGVKVDGKKICLDAHTRNISTASVIDVMEKKNEFSADGLFAGGVTVCLDEFRPAAFTVKLHSQGEGTVMVNKDTPVEFLKRRMDEKSYEAFVANFNNYKYNNGEITVNLDEGIYTVRVNLDSETMGKRELTVTFHKGGGEQ